MFTKPELESWLADISVHVHKSTSIYLIGGCALSFKDIKARTKDIDIITISKKDFDALNHAMLKSGFKLDTDLDNEFYLTALAVYKKEDSRIDVFLNKVGQMLTFTSSMKKRSTLYKDYGELKVFLVSNEDIFLFKAMTPREGDIYDCESIMRLGPDYGIIYREALEQSKEGNKWFFWVFEKICAIENYTGKMIPIKSKIYALVKEYWGQKPDDFMQDIENLEQHIADKRLLKELRK
ncbi:TPA: hypothetical protein HA246_06185 [Candidatus Woesearchaeota archaeon]|nr:hypothetical protein [Candidatus Woesearchaeota archaeon]